MNPLEQPGIAVEDQLRSWSEINVVPFDKNEVHPYTRARVIVMKRNSRRPSMGSTPVTRRHSRPLSATNRSPST